MASGKMSLFALQETRTAHKHAALPVLTSSPGQRPTLMLRMTHLLAALYVAWASLPYFYRVTPTFVAAAVLAVWIICASLHLGSKFFRTRIPFILVGITTYVTWLVFEYLRVQHGVSSGNLLVNVVYFVPLLFFLFLRKEGGKSLKTFLTWWMACSTITAVTNIQILIQDPTASKYLTGSVPGVAERYSASNLASIEWVVAAALAVPVLCAIAAGTQKWGTRLVVGFAILCHLIFILLAGSSTASVVTVVALIFLVVWNKPSSLIYATIVTLLYLSMRNLQLQGMAALNVENWDFYAARLTELRQIQLGSGGSDGSFSLRMVALSVSFLTFLSHPLIGVGMLYGSRIEHPSVGMHSQIVDDLARYGIVGATILSASYISGAKRLFTAVGHKGKRYLLVVVASATLLSLFDPTRSPVFGVCLLFALPAASEMFRRTKNGGDLL